MVILLACAPVFIAWLAVCGPWYLARYRASRLRRRRQAAWARLEPELSGLDAGLDRAWRTERDRINRQP
jgi:hypothetical protein